MDMDGIIYVPYMVRGIRGRGMGRLLATTVYLDEGRKKGLHRAAKAKGSRFSEEIGSAIRQHLAGRGPKKDVDPEGLRRLAREADQCGDRMLRRLDDTNRRLDSLIRRIERSNQRALGGRR